MALELYYRCPTCAGSGRVLVGDAFRQFYAHHPRGPDGRVECTACGGTGWLRTDWTVPMVEGLLVARGFRRDEGVKGARQ